MSSIKMDRGAEVSFQEERSNKYAGPLKGQAHRLLEHKLGRFRTASPHIALDENVRTAIPAVEKMGPYRTAEFQNIAVHSSQLIVGSKIAIRSKECCASFAAKSRGKIRYIWKTD